MSAGVARIPTLDGWRGIAILLVVISHVNVVLGSKAHWVESLGKHGVTMFFVLSGYLITARLLSEKEREEKLQLESFYIRRFFRLMPVAWAYLLLIVFLEINSGRGIAGVHLIPCLFFFRNFVDKTGLDATTVHFWSLSIEEQFYFTWPFVLMFANRKTASWIALLGAVSIAAWRFHHWTALELVRPRATLGTQYHADSLLVGCLAALLVPLLKDHLKTWIVWPLIAFLAYRTAVDYSLIPLYESILIAILLLTTSQRECPYINRVLNSNVLVKVGIYSYCIYLWQELVFFSHTPKGLFLSLLIVALLVKLSHTFIEMPMIQLGRSLSRKVAGKSSHFTVVAERH